MDSKSIIKNAMVTSGFTLTRVVQELNGIGNDTTIQNLSNKMNRDTLRFNEVEQILNVMGQTLITGYINYTEITNNLVPFLTQEEMQHMNIILYNQNVPYEEKLRLRNLMVHSNDNCRSMALNFIDCNMKYLAYA